MFTESAEFYDAIYFSIKDYPAEARDLAARIRAERPGARTVLDVACGTGEHARLLATEHGFEVDGVDLNPDFLRLARRKHPAGRFDLADMATLALPRRYDAVICMFSSIGYVGTLPALERTLAAFREHLAPGGVVIVEPWFPPGVLEPGRRAMQSAEVGGIRVERVSTTTIDGRISRLRFDYTFAEAGSRREASELHELGLFTTEEMLEAFAKAGLPVRHEAPAAGTRGLYIARSKT